MPATDTSSDFAVHEELLLRICAAPDSDHLGRMKLLDDAGWAKLAGLAEDKRVSALVLRALDIAEARQLVPAAPLKQMESARQWHALYALKQMAAIKRLMLKLGDAEFRPILLKGFGLAHASYPDPGLRPLRDVDLLLTAEEAPKAQALLLADRHYRIAPWAGSYGMDYGHQLPEIQDIGDELTIEIHHRINARNWPQEPLLLEMLRCEATDLSIMGIDVLIPSHRSNFLHLAEHATLHHAFENGPLILADLHFLVTRHRPDWSEILEAASRMGLLRALQLLMAVAQQLGASWVPENFMNTDAVGCANVAAAKLGMLQSHEQAEQYKLLRRLEKREGGNSGWLAAFRRLAHPDPHELAKLAGSRSDDMRRWLYYPAWVLQKGQRYLSTSLDPRSLEAARREASMVEWLSQSD